MGNLILTMFIMGCFAVCGYSAYLGLGKPGRSLLSSFLISAWFGLLLLVMLSTNIYFLFKWGSVKDFSSLLFGALFVISIITFLLTRNKNIKINVNRGSICILIVSTMAMIAISIPFLEKHQLAFYYSNNGEYIIYATISDIIQFHDANIVPTVQTTQNYIIYAREAIIGMLCALFSSLTHKSSLLIIQSLSNAFSWLVFLSLGVLFIHLGLGKNSNRWAQSVLFCFYSAALLSAANLQLWTLSFMSFYLNMMVLMGFVIFVIERKPKSTMAIANGSSGFLKNYSSIIVIMAGTLLTLGLVYPEMFVGSSLFILFFYIFWQEKLSQTLFYRKLLSFILAIFIAFILGNTFLIDMLKSRMWGSINGGGWDLYGASGHYITILGNIFGLSNIFWGFSSPSIYIFMCLIILIFLGIYLSVINLINKKWQPVKILYLLFLGYIPSCALVFTLLNFWEVKTNYAAVKFMMSWIWFVYLALGYVFSINKSFYVRSVIAVFGIAVFSNVLFEGYLFAANLRQDAYHTTYTETDIQAITTKLAKNRPLLVSDPEIWNFNEIGAFLILNQHLFPRVNAISGNVTEVWNKTVPPKIEYKKFPYLLFLGTNHLNAKVLGFHVIYQSMGVTLLQKNELAQ